MSNYYYLNQNSKQHSIQTSNQTMYSMIQTSIRLLIDNYIAFYQISISYFLYRLLYINIYIDFYQLSIISLAKQHSIQISMGKAVLLTYTYVISYRCYVIACEQPCCLCMSFLKLLRAVLRASESYLLNSITNTTESIADRLWTF